MKQREGIVNRRLAIFVLADPEPMLWGNELIHRDGKPVGYTTSGSYGHTVGAAIAMGYVNNAGGATAEFFQGAALLVDVIGSSNLQSERLSVDVPKFINKSGTSEFPNGAKRFSQDVSTDIVDVVPGVKFAVGENVIGFVEFFVPINDDGLRTHFTPAGGIQATF